MDILNLDIFEDHKLEEQLRQIGTGKRIGAPCIPGY